MFRGGGSGVERVGRMIRARGEGGGGGPVEAAGL
jgi:hypothetical protein